MAAADPLDDYRRAYDLLDYVPRHWQLEVTLRDGSRSVAGAYRGTREQAEDWFDNYCEAVDWNEPKLVLG